MKGRPRGGGAAGWWVVSEPRRGRAADLCGGGTGWHTGGPLIPRVSGKLPNGVSGCYRKALLLSRRSPIAGRSSPEQRAERKPSDGKRLAGRPFWRPLSADPSKARWQSRPRTGKPARHCKAKRCGHWQGRLSNLTLTVTTGNAICPTLRFS